MTIAADHVDIVFQCLLGRHPESETTARAFQALPDVASAIAAIRSSSEAELRVIIDPAIYPPHLSGREGHHARCGGLRTDAANSRHEAIATPYSEL